MSVKEAFSKDFPVDAATAREIKKEVKYFCNNVILDDNTPAPSRCRITRIEPSGRGRDRFSGRGLGRGRASGHGTGRASGRRHGGGRASRRGNGHDQARKLGDNCHKHGKKGSDFASGETWGRVVLRSFCVESMPGWLDSCRCRN